MPPSMTTGVIGAVPLTADRIDRQSTDVVDHLA